MVRIRPIIRTYRTCNTLVLKEVKTLLEEGRAVGDREFRDYLEVQGYAEAAQWVYEHAVYDSRIWSARELIKLTELREIHRLVVEPVWRHFPPSDQDPNQGPASFRRKDIELFAEGMKRPPWPDVPPLVTDWVALANGFVDEMVRFSAGDPSPPHRIVVRFVVRTREIRERLVSCSQGRSSSGLTGSSFRA